MFNINQADLDWLTVTSYNPMFSRRLKFWLETMPETKDLGESRWLNYSGKRFATRKGSIFLGEGEQQGDPHYASWASGRASEGLWFQSNKPFLEQNYAKVTRIDLQITVPYCRETWSQSEFFAALRKVAPSRVITYSESASGPAGAKLATVYWGARSGECVYRMYEKLGMGDDVYFRFEVEYKGARARKVTDMLLGDSGPANILVDEIKSVPDVCGLHSMLLAPLLDTESHPVKLVKPDSNTEKWLRDQVVPALDRILNDHNANHAEIAVLFRRVLDSYDSGQLDT